jgi:TatD DNase family protein
MLVDSHVHLNSPEFGADLGQVLARARAAGVGRFLCPGYDLPSSRAAAALAAAESDVLAAVGVHPHDARTYDDAAESQLEALLGASRVVAVGETGLDYHYEHSPRDVQLQALRRQLRLARRLARPVVIHNRESDDDMVRVLSEEAAGLRLVLHAFTGAPRLAAIGAHAGFFFGIGGFLTFKKHPLAECVRDLPRQSLLLETDAPYLSPHPHRGRRNEPAHVQIVAQRLAAILDLPLAELVALTARNFQRFLVGDGMAGST